MTVSAVLREAIREAERAGTTRYRIALESRISASIVHKFMDGAELRSSTIDRLAEHLGLELRPKKRKRNN